VREVHHSAPAPGHKKLSIPEHPASSPSTTAAASRSRFYETLLPEFQDSNQKVPDYKLVNIVSTAIWCAQVQEFGSNLPDNFFTGVFRFNFVQNSVI
jgi:hypothetical protein